MAAKAKKSGNGTLKTVANHSVSPIYPDVLYPYRAFQIAAGIGPTKIREARLAGIELAVIQVGRRKYAEGHAIQAFLKAIASCPALNGSR